jgi:putative flippase GtrA
MIARAAGMVWRRTYARYIFASAVALCADGALFLLLLGSGMAPTPASVLGYGAGIGVHWLLSSRAVFTGPVAYSREGRARRKALFLGSAITGLGITATIVTLGDMLHIDPRLAKLAAVAVSFQTTYFLRKKVVFSR